MKLPAGVRDDRTKIPASIKRAIKTPHDHEGKHNPPLWLIWKVEQSQATGVPFFPVLDTVCDSVRSCEYHVLMILDENARLAQTHGSSYKETDVYVERIPANHRFGSSLPELQMKTHMQVWKAREVASLRNPREGD